MPSHPTNKIAPANYLLIFSLFSVINELYGLIFLSPWVHHGSGHEGPHSAPDGSSADGTQPQIEGTGFTSYQVATGNKHNRHISVHAHFAHPLLLQAPELFFCAQLRLYQKTKEKTKAQAVSVLSQLQSASCDSLGSHTATCLLFCEDGTSTSQASFI